MKNLLSDAEKIIKASIKTNLPNEAVREALHRIEFVGDIFVLAIGKAAYKMAVATNEILKERIKSGVVITKYNHAEGKIDNFDIFEAGHPILDENSIKATEYTLEKIKELDQSVNILLLISGGGSALFESSELDLAELNSINSSLLKSGANISEINCVRKHLSKVKGGRLAELCANRKIYSLILSDVLGDRLDTIASGPATSDASTSDEAIAIIKKYNLKVSDSALNILSKETPKKISNVESYVIGNLGKLCEAAKTKAEGLGYEAVIVDETVDCDASDAGKFIGDYAKKHRNESNRAFIFGGETTVKVKGTGLGGRNQELVLYAAKECKEIENVLIFSIGSDGTDGPTDAAGGFVDGSTIKKLADRGIDIDDYLENNDSYNALKKIDQLIITGPTGTNVNDLSVILIGD